MGKVGKIKRNEKDRKNKKDGNFQIINFDIIPLPKYYMN